MKYPAIKFIHKEYDDKYFQKLKIRLNWKTHETWYNLYYVNYFAAVRAECNKCCANEMQHDCWENEYRETSVLLGITAGGAPVPCDGAIPISIRIFEGGANHLSKSVHNKRMGLAIIESDDDSAFSNFEMGSSTFFIGNYKIREISFCFSTSPLQTSAT
jgi:hypothetical protein